MKSRADPKQHTGGLIAVHQARCSESRCEILKISQVEGGVVLFVLAAGYVKGTVCISGGTVCVPRLLR